MSALQGHISVGEMAGLLGVSGKTVERALAARELTHVKIGHRTVRIPVSAAAEWVARRTVRGLGGKVTLGAALEGGAAEAFWGRMERLIELAVEKKIARKNQGGVAASTRNQTYEQASDGEGAEVGGAGADVPGVRVHG